MLLWYMCVYIYIYTYTYTYTYVCIYIYIYTLDLSCAARFVQPGLHQAVEGLLGDLVALL